MSEAVKDVCISECILRSGGVPGRFFCAMLCLARILNKVGPIWIYYNDSN